MTTAVSLRIVYSNSAKYLNTNIPEIGKRNLKISKVPNKLLRRFPLSMTKMISQRIIVMY